jgi:hypothetical protein
VLFRVTGCFVDLYWLPVGAGTSRAQQASLRLWEAVSAALSRRPRSGLYHPGLKIALPGVAISTLELTPAFIGRPEPPAMTGPVGFRGADRLPLFRYQLRRLRAETLPDEEWAVASPIRLSQDCVTAQAILDLAGQVPPYTWGRRVKGTTEMWTSASVIAWILVHAGIDAAAIALPPGGRAPGWDAGLELASRSHARPVVSA